jgi:hypothetical protein
MLCSPVARIQTCGLRFLLRLSDSSFPVGGAWSWPLTPSSDEVKEWVELYLHFPNTASWRGAPLKHRDNFTFTFIPRRLLFITIGLQSYWWINALMSYVKSQTYTMRFQKVTFQWGTCSYRLRNLGSVSDRVMKFSLRHHTLTAVEPTQPPIQQVLRVVLLPIKRAEPEADLRT